MEDSRIVPSLKLGREANGELFSAWFLQLPGSFGSCATVIEYSGLKAEVASKADGTWVWEWNAKT